MATPGRRLRWQRAILLARPDPRMERYLLGAWAEKVAIPFGQISIALAEALGTRLRQTLQELARGADNRRGSSAITLPGVTATLVTNVKRSVVRDRNVVASLEGSDAVLKDQWIVISGHPDHDGALGDQIWNGADDNGSGTVGLVAIAEAYALAAREGKRPRRSILFAAFNSEERGLLGAWAFTEAPLVPLPQIVAVLNMDMIGRNEEVPTNTDYRFRGLEVQSARSNENAVNLLGYSYAPELSDEVTRANTALRLEIKRRYDDTVANLIQRSDQWPFLQRGIPAVWFFTGLHLDYHSPADRADKINYAKMARVVRLVHQTSWLLAEREGSLPRVRR